MGCFGWIADRIFYDWVDPDDAFHIRTRKLLMCVTLGFAPTPFFGAMLGFMNAVNAPNEDQLILSLFQFMSEVLVIVLFVTCYLYCRGQRAVSDVTMFVWAFCINFLDTVLAISVPGFPILELTFIVVIVVMLADTKWKPLIYALHLPPIFVPAYNRVAFTPGGPPALVLAGFGQPTTNDAFVFVLLQIACTLIVILGLRLQAQQHTKLVREAVQAVTTAGSVARLLRDYDTLGVRQLLKETREDGTCDPEFLAPFAALVENLERYRPHLPNWVLMEADGDDNESQSDAQAEPAPLSGSTTHSDTRRSTKNVVDRKASVHSTVSSSTGPRSVLLSAVEYTGKICAAQLSLQFDAAAAAMQQNSAKVTTKLVDHIHRVAAETHAAIHGMVGDTVLATWNAAHRSGLPEVKACRFLHRVREAVHPAVTVTGAAMTGQARCLVAGSENMPKALTVSMPHWFAALRAVANHAQRHKTVFACDATLKAAQFEINAHLVDGLVFPTQPAPPIEELVIGEVIGEIVASDDAEWMYTLQQRDTAARPGAMVTEVVLRCLAGDFDGASRSVAAIPPGERATPTVQWVLARLQRCVERDPTAQFKTAVAMY